MNLLENALKLAEKEFHVFPLLPNTKFPAVEDFPNTATRDPEIIKSWWSKWPNANIGISTTRYNGSCSLLAVDVDNKDGRKGSEELFKLELEGKEFPETFTQETPTGGEHLFYVVDKPVKQGANVFAKGIDTRGNGGYVVAAGSVINGKRYTVKNPSTPRPAPKWMLEFVRESKAKKEKLPDVVVNQETARDRALEYIKTAPKAEKGERNHTAYIVAAKVKDLGLNKDECFHLLAEHYEGASPALELDELRSVVENAYRYGENPVGAESPEAAFTVVEPEENRSYLERINKEYALVFEPGGHFILKETVSEDGNPTVRFLPETTFKRELSTETIIIGDGKQVPQSSIWLNWNGRRTYNGTVFAPERKARNGYYNLWRGFSCKPIPYKDANEKQRAGFDSFIEHAFENVCDKDRPLFNWLMGYFAHMIQKPYERPLTTLVFQGLKGTGKNTLMDRIGFLLGQRHYLVAQDGRYLTSNFNGHLEECLCLVLDEAFWSGDKSAEGKLKGLTTSPTILIERKGREPYTVSNLVRLVVIGNEDWLVPASADERRYAVFKVGTGRMQDGVFFERMRKNMDEEGGAGVLLHYLKTFDLSKVNPNKAPETEGLTEQVLKSLEPFPQWWNECLDSGFVVCGMSTEWPEQMDKTVFRQAFERYCKERSITSRRPHDTVIGRLLKSYCRSVHTDQKRREGFETVHIYKFPTLEVARADFEHHLRQKIWNKEPKNLDS